MTQDLTEWLDNERGQTSALQRTRIETTKLLATFSAALAATVVATALQVGTPNTFDHISVWFLMATALGAVIVILLDRTREVDTDAIVRDAYLNSWESEKLLEELRNAAFEAQEANGPVVLVTRIGAICTAVAALLAGTFATLSLLQPPA